MPSVSPQLLLRAAALGVAVVIIQVAAVSQVVIFGTSADLTPLVVAVHFGTIAAANGWWR